jgi:hypothetical protein
MHGTTRPRPAIHPVGSGVNAVVWIEPGRAIVLRGGGGGEPASLELPIPYTAAATPPALAEVAHQIGDVDRLLVLGTDDLRTALEREVVAIGHHPESIREEAMTGPLDRAALLERLRRLA